MGVTCVKDPIPQLARKQFHCLDCIWLLELDISAPFFFFRWEKGIGQLDQLAYLDFWPFFGALDRRCQQVNHLGSGFLRGIWPAIDSWGPGAVVFLGRKAFGGQRGRFSWNSVPGHTGWERRISRITGLPTFWGEGWSWGAKKTLPRLRYPPRNSGFNRALLREANGRA